MYGIFTYIYHRNQPNVGKKIPYMDGMGMYESEQKSASMLRQIPWPIELSEVLMPRLQGIQTLRNGSVRWIPTASFSYQVLTMSQTV